MKIKVKNREELAILLDNYIEKYKDYLCPEGLCSEKSIREQDNHRHDLFASKVLDVEKTTLNNPGEDFNYYYVYCFYGKNGEKTYWPIYPDEIVEEIHEALE